MTSNRNSGNGHGSGGAPQTSLEEMYYEMEIDEIERTTDFDEPSLYAPSPKHDEKHGWGSVNPIKSQLEGQMLLDEGFWEGRQVYNVTDEGKIVKFQPSGTSNNEYHSYEVSKPRDIPSSILKQLLNAGKITRSEYNKLRKGKRK